MRKTICITVRTDLLRLLRAFPPYHHRPLLHLAMPPQSLTHNNRVATAAHSGGYSMSRSFVVELNRSRRLCRIAYSVICSPITTKCYYSFIVVLCYSLSPFYLHSLLSVASFIHSFVTGRSSTFRSIPSIHSSIRNCSSF